jgi:hypothetical protein
MEWVSSHGLPHSQLHSWSESDRAKLIAHLLEEQTRCSSCGTAGWEWKSDRFAYEASAHYCQGCFLLDAAAEDSTQRRAGMKIVLLPKAIAAQQEAKARTL